MRRMLNTLIVINDMNKSAFDEISEADSSDELSVCFQAADKINLKQMVSMNSLSKDEKIDALLPNRSKCSNKSCPPIHREEIRKSSAASSHPVQLHADSSLREISEFASSMPVWIEDEDADCIADCDEREELLANDRAPLVHSEEICVFKA